MFNLFKLFKFVTAFNPFSCLAFYPFCIRSTKLNIYQTSITSGYLPKLKQKEMMKNIVHTQRKSIVCLYCFSIRDEQQQQQTNVKVNSYKQKCVVNANQNVKVRITQTESELECDLRNPKKRTASEMKKSNQAANAANRMKANRIQQWDQGSRY